MSDAERAKLAVELEYGLPCTADREVLLAALRGVQKLARRWQAGINDTGPAAAAEVMDAIRGDL